MEPRIVFAPQSAVNAGEVVTVRWDHLPEDVDELEFLLQRENGDVVRLTEQLVPSSGSFRWVVPNLPSRRAVLVLRVGIEGREVTLASSDPFVIHGAASRGRLRFRNGEWWTSEFSRPPTDTPQVSFRTKERAPQVFQCGRRPLYLTAKVALGRARLLERLERSRIAANTRCGPPRTIPQRK
jgi:hypothetical protein